MALEDAKAESLAGLVPKCNICGDTMVVRTRKRDGKQFFGCSQFPKCAGTRSYEDGVAYMEAMAPKLKAEAEAAGAKAKQTQGQLAGFAMALKAKQTAALPGAAKVVAGKMKLKRKSYAIPVDDDGLIWLNAIEAFKE